MTERRFYTSALLLPFVVPLAVAPIAIPAMRADAGSPNALTQLATLVYLTTVLAAFPYAVALPFVFWQVRSARTASFRRLVWTVPLWISLAFAVVFSLSLGGPVTGLTDFATGMLLGVGYALPVAYAYSVLIELVHAVGARCGCIRDPAPSLAA